MSQKVWVIPDPYGEKPSAKRGSLDNWHQGDFPEQTRRNNPPPPRKQKNPALSFSLSMFVWGSGHMYIRKYGAGLMFLASMIFFYAGIISVVAFRDSYSRLLFQIDISPSRLVITLIVFFMLGLLLWMFNAVDSYFRTLKLRSEPFQGVENELWPLVCSILFPGWGQFVNGQSRKGLFFLLFGVLGIFALSIFLIAQNVWHVLNTSQDWLILELVMAAALWVVPLSILMWFAAAYDAFSSCRASVGYRRVRMQGSVQDHFPRVTAILSLLLAISLGMQLFPREYYLESLGKLRNEMLNRNMQIIPELVGKAIVLINMNSNVQPAGAPLIGTLGDVESAVRQE